MLYSLGDSFTVMFGVLGLIALIISAPIEFVYYWVKYEELLIKYNSIKEELDEANREIQEYRDNIDRDYEEMMGAEGRQKELWKMSKSL